LDFANHPYLCKGLYKYQNTRHWRQLLPFEFVNKRAKYIRYRLYAIAAKAIKTGRKVIIKCQAQYYQLLTKVLLNQPSVVLPGEVVSNVSLVLSTRKPVVY
jgi:hypothetical protein